MSRTVRATAVLIAAAPFLSTGVTAAAERFVTPSGAGGACTQSSPCALATALASAGAGDTVYLAGGVYTGTGREVVALDRTLALLGGWNGAPAGAVVRDPVAHESVLDGESARRVVTITGGAPTLDGLTVRRGNAAGTGADCSTSPEAACGGGILVHGSGATISGCRVVDNVGDGGTPAAWRNSYGGGILVLWSDDVVVRDNTISGNTASAASAGNGGGIAVYGGTNTLITGNRITGNHATTASVAGWGGGISLSGGGHDGKVSGNVLAGNEASPDLTNSHGNSLFTWYFEGLVDGNRMTSDHLGSAVYVGYFTGALTGNTVLAGAESWVVRLVNGNTGASEGYRLANNVLAAGAGALWVLHVDGYAEGPVTASVRHNTIVGNGGSTGVLVDAYGTADLENNILSGHATALATAGNGALTADHTLFFANDDDGLRGSDPLDGDPRFVNAAAGDFHVGPGSAAVGAAVRPAGCVSVWSGCSTVDDDVDGEARPGADAPDVGADETAPRAFDFGTASSPVAPGYTRVTHATAFTAGEGFGWTYGTIASRDRGGANDDLRRDFCFTHTGTFAVTVPDGRYRVTVTMGDAAAGHGQMAVFLENVKVASLSAAGNDFKSLTFETPVRDGQLTLWLNDEGGSDPNVVLNALTIEPALPVRVDLGTAASPVAPGFVRATHATAWADGAAVGWRGGARQSRDRGTADPLRRDLVFTPRGILGHFLANGAYDVTVTLGDAAAAHNLMGVSVQGWPFVQVGTAKNQFAELRSRTQVADGRLDVLLDDLEGPDPNVVVNAVEISPPPVPSFDFGTAASPVAEGRRQVTHETAYTAARGYGWQSGAVGSRDRGTSSPLYRDFNLSADATFAADVRPGRYRVTVSLGDPTFRHDQMGVYLEGVLVGTYTVQAGDLAAPTFTVDVTDGQLTLRVADLGGADPNVVLAALEVR